MFAALLLSIVVPFAYFLSGTKNKARYKLTIGTNAAAFFGIMLVACGFMFSGNAQAAEAAAETAQAAGGLSTGMGYLAAALVTGLSCIGGGIAVASAASAALGAISEDSSILGIYDFYGIIIQKMIEYSIYYKQVVPPCQDENVKIRCIFQIEYSQIPLYIVTAR